MTIQSAFTSDRMCLALTGMTVFEFNNLLPGFSTTLTEAQRARNTQRIRAFGGGRTGLLPTPAHKLFAALVYMKVYPTYDVLSFFLRLDRTRCFRWIQFLLPVLATTLGRYLVLPKRQIRSVEEFFREFPEAKDIFIDGTERRIQKLRESKTKKEALLREKEGNHTENRGRIR